MAVIYFEIDRIKKVKKKTSDEQFKEQLTVLLEILEFKRESIQNDIDGGFMTPKDYLEANKVYLKAERSNLNKAKLNGVDEDNINVIKKRIKHIKEEIKEGEKATGVEADDKEEQQEKEEEHEEVPDGPVERKATGKKKKEEEESSEGETLLYDHDKYNLLIARMKRYELAFNYAQDVLKNKSIASRMKDDMETLQQTAAEYKMTYEYKTENIPLSLTPEILFGMSLEDKEKEF